MEIRTEEVCGYYVEEKLYCSNCYEDKNKQVHLLVKSEVEKQEKIFLCDECNRLIK